MSVDLQITEEHKSLTEKAIRNVRDIVTVALLHTPPEKALVIYDTHDQLTQILTEAYRVVLPDARYIDFDTSTKELIIEAIDSLSPHDLVVLIQSTDLRLNEFRIRIHLFKRGLKVIDHQHLKRNIKDTWETYINALAYDKSWYRTIGPKLKAKLMNSDTLTFTAGKDILTLRGGVETPKLNIGDYSGMKNVGGTFPIGELFTEANDLTKLHGSMLVYAFAGDDFVIEMHDPFRVDIEDGLVVSWGKNAPSHFAEIVARIKSNERPIIREIGFGLNKAITREHYLKDITAFERMLGIHFSVGEKHTVYKKPGITADKTRYHVDLFPVVDEVMADQTVIFKNGQYMI